jgi:hypothetical protein
MPFKKNLFQFLFGRYNYYEHIWLNLDDIKSENTCDLKEFVFNFFKNENLNQNDWSFCKKTMNYELQIWIDSRKFNLTTDLTSSNLVISKTKDYERSSTLLYFAFYIIFIVLPFTRNITSISSAIILFFFIFYLTVYKSEKNREINNWNKGIGLIEGVIKSYTNSINNIN